MTHASRFNSKKFQLPLLSVCLMLLISGTSFAATYYMPDNFANLRAACAGMSSGDTLIIRDGSYSGSNNILDQTTLPPSGTSSSYTRITAEHTGGAVFPNGFLIMTGTSSRQYISFEGLRALDWTEVGGVNHFKFLRCSFTTERDGNAECFYLENCSYILVEDCWAYGGGRYKFICYGRNSTSDSHHIVFRRCVARMDRVSASAEPTAPFSIYRSQYVALQNCIVIDGDQDSYWYYAERSAAFYTPHEGQYITLDSCIALNHKSYFAGGSPGPGLVVKNCAAWNLGAGVGGRLDGRELGVTGTMSVDKCTFGRMAAILDCPSEGGFYSDYGSSGSSPATNSIFYNITSGAAIGVASSSAITSNYNLLYNNSTDFSGVSKGAQDMCASNNNAKDPIDGNPGNGIAALKHLVRIESGSDAKGTGSLGSDRGANILYKVGVSGTFYGDTGWSTVTSDPLWPFPNEDRIKSDMAAYTYTGTHKSGGPATLSGARGFCAGNSLDGTPQSLTKYIWEYLGYTMPSGIYSTDTTPPSAPQGVSIQIIN